MTRSPPRRVGAIFSPAAEAVFKEEFFGAHKGYFVDVGANEPQADSQTWQLEQTGWTGVLIEPQPDLADVLRRTRRAKVYAVACSSPQRAGRPVRIHLAGPHSSLIPNLIVSGVPIRGSVEVPVRTLDDILTDAGAPVPIDFLSIDVEGHEIEVLTGFDVARWRPRLILIEDHVVSLDKHRHLTRAGYRLVRRTGLNAWYVPSVSAETVDWLGRWQLFRKYYLGLPFRVLRDAMRRVRQRL